MIAAIHNGAILLAQLFNRGDQDPGEVSYRAQIIAIVGTLLFLGFVIELVRRRKLVERYALLWMTIAIFGVVMAVWNDALNWLAEQSGIESPTNALFLLGLVAVVAMLLNFSAAISRAQRGDEDPRADDLPARRREPAAAGRGAAAPNGNGDEPAERRREPPTRAEPPVRPRVGAI